MARIPVPTGVPGIVSLFVTRPEMAAPMKELAEVLLRRESSLTRGEREIIAAVVSTRNECVFCSESHAAFAAEQTEGGMEVVAAARRDPATAPIRAKLKALLVIAQQVQRSGKAVTDQAACRRSRRRTRRRTKGWRSGWSRTATCVRSRQVRSTARGSRPARA